MQRVGVVEGAIGGADRFASVAALFPHVTFESAGPIWPDHPSSDLDILVVPLSAGAADEVTEAIRRLGAAHSTAQIVIALRDADVTTTRRLVRAGAADVLPAPVSEPTLALCLERLLTGDHDAAPGRKQGEVVAMLKAGGGVGATSLATQMAAYIASRLSGEVCLADLDLQFGAAAVYMDLPEAVSITDCLSSGSGLGETPFSTVLATHKSGARLLAAPRDMVALETLDPAHVDALLGGMRRDFPLTIVDLPPAWTAWTNQVLHQADRIVLVTHLSVPHIQLVKRQLRILASQRLEDRPMVMVCNSLSSDQTASVSLKAAERAMGRPFDVVLPEDRRTMTAAINQGVEISAVRRGTKLEKGVAELAGKIGAAQPALQAQRGWR